MLSPPQFDVRAAVGTNDNMGQAERGRDIVDDRFFELTAGAGYRLTLFNGWLDATGRGFLAAQRFSKIKGLGHYGGGLELGLEGRLGSSSLPPFYRVLLRAKGEEYDFQQRDSTVLTGSLTVGTNIGPRTTVALGGEYRDRRARSDVFDLREWSAFIDAGYEFAPNWRLGARATYTDGDVWSTIQAVLPDGQPVDDIFDLIAASKVIQRDDAFNDELAGQWFVYRLPATTGKYSLGVTRSINERFALGLEWLEIRVKAKRDNDYDNRLLQLSFDVKF
ncbi:MAG: hypothetical protein KF911_14395 [Pseudomonadales bacterium]|nr:hypothetical protein [Pseudomonadales bacterium]